MKKLILLLTFVFVIVVAFAQSENSNSFDTKGTENIVEKKLGNLIIQTIPSALKIEIPQMGINGNKTQDSLILEEIYTGRYDLTFRLKKKKFNCSVEVLNQKTIHLLVDFKERKFETKEINYNPHLPDPIPVPVDTSAVYVIVDDMPEFPGGTLELRKWIAMNVNYPLKAMQNGVAGRVFTSCVINTDGKVENIKVIRSVNPDLDAEAIRLISSMPTWKPGRRNGQLTKVSYTFPINFQLAGNLAVDTSEIYVIVDEMPEFPGGMLECQKWIAMNIKYPLRAMQNGITGRVFITCVINKEGNVENVEVVRSVSPDLDAEAVKVISNMPTWKPGRQNGQLTKVSYTFPINFEME